LNKYLLIILAIVNFPLFEWPGIYIPKEREIFFRKEKVKSKKCLLIKGWGRN